MNKGTFITGAIGLVAGVAITGIQSELKIQQIDKALKIHDLKIDRCDNYIGVLPTESTLKCNQP